MYQLQVNNLQINMSNEEIEVLSAHFHKTLMSFCDEMIASYKKPAFVMTRVILPTLSANFIFGRINNVLPTLRKIVETRDTTLYKEIEGKFGEMDLAVNATISLIDEGEVEKENEDAIWKWVESFVLFTDKYNELVAASSTSG